MSLLAPAGLVAQGGVFRAPVAVDTAGGSSVRLELVGGWGGPVHAFARDGDLGYVATGQRLVVLDLTDIDEPTEVGSINLGGSIQDVKIREGFVYVSVHSTDFDFPREWVVLDVSDPGVPEIVWHHMLPFRRVEGDIEFSGDLAYFCSQDDVLLFDVSNPASPVLLAQPEFFNPVLLALSEPYALGTSGTGSHARVWDISDPMSPKEGVALKAIDEDGPQIIRQIDVEDGVAYLLVEHDPVAGGRKDWVVSFDFSNPSAPERLGQYLVADRDQPASLGGLATTMDVRDGRIYVAVRSFVGLAKHVQAQGLVILDATSPAQLALLGRFKTHGDIRGVHAGDGDLVYLFDHGEGLVIVDVSDPGAPLRRGTFHSPGSMPDMIRDGDLIYVADRWNGISIIDVSDPTHPSLVGVYQTRQEAAGGGNWGIDVRGGTAYISTGEAGFEIVDVSDPTEPVFVGGFLPWPAGVTASDIRLDPSGSVLFVATVSSVTSLVSFDVSDPGDVVDIDAVVLEPGQSFVNDIELLQDGAVAHLTRHGRVQAVDTSDPAALSLLSTFDHGGFSSPRDLVLIENGATGTRRLITEATSSDLYLYSQDVSDPSQPGEPIAFEPGWPGHAMAVHENHLFQVAANGRVVLWDISDLLDPVRLYVTDAGYVGGESSMSGASLSTDGAFVFAALSSDGDAPHRWKHANGLVVFELAQGPLASLTFDPPSLDFGDVEVGTTSSPQSALLQNDGETDLNSLSFSSLDAGFTVDADDCVNDGNTLGVGESCELVFTFTPPTPGASQATLEVNSYEGGRAELGLLGEGIESGQPTLVIDPESLEFEVSEDAAETRILTIGNVGTADLDWSVTTAEPAHGGVIDCDNEPGLILHDDGSVESGYNDSSGAATQVIFADRFTPTTYPASISDVCVAFVTVGVTSLDFEIVVFADDGPEGGPGTELGALPASVDGIPTWPVTAPTWSSHDISSLGITIVSGSVYVGVRWNQTTIDVYLTSDESPDRPAGFAGGFWWRDDTQAWEPIDDAFTSYRSMFVRAIETPLDLSCADPTAIPWLDLDPTSGTAPAGENTPVQVSVDATGLDPGEYEASLCITSNDPVNPLVTVPVSMAALAGAPKLDVDPESLSSVLQQGETDSQSLSISNSGNAALDWHVVEGGDATQGAVPSSGALAHPVTDADPARGVVSGSRRVVTAGGIDCVSDPGLIVHDDGTVESGYSESSGASTQVLFADRFTPSTYPTLFRSVCVAFVTTGPTSLTFDIVVLDDDGPNGSPGTELGTLTVSADGIPFWPVTVPTWSSYDISPLNVTVSSGSVYIGARWAPASPDVYLTSDESPERPVGFAGGYWWNDSVNAWEPIEVSTNASFFDYRSMFVRAIEEAVEMPECEFPGWLGVDPLSGTVLAGEGQVVEVTFDAIDLEPGNYTANLCLGSNDPENPLTVVPLSLSVLEDVRVTAVALSVDPQPQLSDGNQIFEPGESVDVAPSWRNDGGFPRSLAGTATAFTGPEGTTYTLELDAADYGLIDPGAAASCLDTSVCYRLKLDEPAVRPAPHWEATFQETLDDIDGTAKTWTLHIGESFTDVPASSPFYPAIETLLHSGVTGGCADGAYCPADANNRSQMAVFLLKAAEGADYLPPPCTEGDKRFLDVPTDSLFCPWIEALAERGITSGCGNGNYCPSDSVTRGQMAVFLLRAFEGDGYTPPECTSTFDDVLCPSLFADWIEELAARGITSGCGEGNYCPDSEVTRAQMAVFVTSTFGLELYGP